MEQITDKDSKEASRTVRTGEVVGVEVSKAVNVDYAIKGVHVEQACDQGEVHEKRPKLVEEIMCAFVTFTEDPRIKSKTYILSYLVL